MLEVPQKHLIISPMTDIVEYDRWEAGEQLPLHVTVMPWFGGLSVSGLKNALINQCTTYEPFKVAGRENDIFGDEEYPIKVTRLDSAGRLPKIHHDILDIIHRMGGQFESDWVGDKYRSHVSYLGEVGLEIGETRTLDSLGLIGRLADGSLEVEMIVGFSGQLRRRR